MDPNELISFFHTLADAAQKAILPHFRSNLSIENKKTETGGFDPVTIADKISEQAMRNLIVEHYPNHGVIGEEFDTTHQDADYIWVLDPIDGTRAFITGLPTWGILIGLKYKNIPIMGMMAQPFTGERYFGDGHSAFYQGPNGQRQLTTRPCTSLHQATLFTTSPRIFNEKDFLLYDQIEQQVQLARYGVDCYAYCMLASGFVDLVIETELKPFDIVALVPIIKGAGGKVTTWEGHSPASGGRILACGDSALHNTLLDELRS